MWTQALTTTWGRGVGQHFVDASFVIFPFINIVILLKLILSTTIDTKIDIYQCIFCFQRDFVCHFILLFLPPLVGCSGAKICFELCDVRACVLCIVHKSVVHLIFVTLCCEKFLAHRFRRLSSQYIRIFADELKKKSQFIFVQLELNRLSSAGNNKTQVVDFSQSKHRGLCQRNF